MRNVLKWLALAALALLLCPFVYLAHHDWIYVRPLAPSIDALLAEAAPDERAPPAQLLTALRAEYSDDWVFQLARALRIELKPQTPHGGLLGGLNWHLSQAAWAASLWLRYSEAERQTLLVRVQHFGPTGCRGFACAAQALVGAPLREITLAQAARLVAYSTAPNVYAVSAGRLDKKAERLLAKARAAEQLSPDN